MSTHPQEEEDTPITSVSEFLKEIQLSDAISRTQHVEDLTSTTWFRGQADPAWEIRPSLFRHNSLFGSERLIIQEVLRTAPLDFFEPSRLNKLAKMQHYGLPTRLLDVTANPLVALYFACFAASRRDQDGEVLIFKDVRTGPENLLRTQLILDFVFNYSGGYIERESLVGVLGRNHLPQERCTFEEINKILTGPPEVVISRHSNPRLVAQSGAFILFGMHLGEKENCLIDPTREYVSYTPPAPIEDTDYPIYRLQIPTASKVPILGELDRLNINSQTLFPDPEERIKYVADQYSLHALTPTWRTLQFLGQD